MFTARAELASGQRLKPLPTCREKFIWLQLFRPVMKGAGVDETVGATAASSVVEQAGYGLVEPGVTAEMLNSTPTAACAQHTSKRQRGQARVSQRGPAAAVMPSCSDRC